MSAPVAPINTLHVAILKAYPPARMHLRWYWSGEAAEALGRLAGFDAQLRRAAPHYFGDRTVRWHEAFRGDLKWTDMVMSTLQAVLLGDRLPDAVAYEIVRLHRRPRNIPNEHCCAALLEVWATGKGMFGQHADA